MNRIFALLLSLYSWAALSQPIGVWERRAPLPIRATEVAAAAIDSKVYVVCGILPNATRSNRLFIYDPFIDTWSEGATMPAAGDHCNVAAVNGKLYVAGGLSFGPRFGETFEYDPRTDAWASVGRMSVPRGASGTAAIGTKIYVAGGQGSPGAGTAFEVFDTAGRIWTRLPNLPTSRTHLTAQAAAGKLYAIAGRSGGISSVLAANEEFDPVTNRWTARAPMPTARGGLASGVVGGRIQVIGGEGPSGTADRTFEQNEEYDGHRYLADTRADANSAPWLLRRYRGRAFRWRAAIRSGRRTPSRRRLLERPRSLFPALARSAGLRRRGCRQRGQFRSENCSWVDRVIVREQPLTRFADGYETAAPGSDERRYGDHQR